MDFKNIYAEVYSLPEYEIIQEMTSFKESISLLKLNYTELSRHFEHFRKTILNILSDEIPYKNVNIETKRLIHNYLNSAISLIDHTRIYVRNLHSDIDLFEYQKQIKSIFTNNSLCIFVKDLRQYIQHVKLPEISFQKNRFSISNYASMIISKQELLKFSGWTKKSREYIQNQSDNIDLRIVLKDYQSIVVGFYDWLINWQEDVFQDNIKMIENLKLSIVQTHLQAVLQKLLKAKYEDYSSLEYDLYLIIPEKISRMAKFDAKEKLNEIFNLFETDTFSKFLIVKNLEVILNKQ